MSREYSLKRSENIQPAVLIGRCVGFEQFCWNGDIKSSIVPFDEKYLASQFFVSPYPEALIELSDSGK